MRCGMGKFHRPTKAATATAKGTEGMQTRRQPQPTAPIQSLTAPPNNRHQACAMPRSPRREFPRIPAPCHATGVNRCAIFVDPIDHRHFDDRLRVAMVEHDRAVQPENIRAHLQQERALGDTQFHAMVEKALGCVKLRNRGRPRNPHSPLDGDSFPPSPFAGAPFARSPHKKIGPRQSTCEERKGLIRSTQPNATFGLGV